MGSLHIVDGEKHLYFIRDGFSKSGKTEIWSVYNQADEKLGVIKWFAQWRQYCFFSEKSIFSRSCHREIDAHMDKLMDER